MLTCCVSPQPDVTLIEEMYSRLGKDAGSLNGVKVKTAAQLGETADGQANWLAVLYQAKCLLLVTAGAEEFASASPQLTMLLGSPAGSSDWLCKGAAAAGGRH